jgi:hypothetical protein
MRPTAHPPTLIAVAMFLVCLSAALAAARTPATAVVPSAALAATEKAPCQYESYWPHLLLRTPSLALPHPPARADWKRPSRPIFRPQQIVEPVRKRPSRPIFRPQQIVEPVRRAPSVRIFWPLQIER